MLVTSKNEIKDSGVIARKPTYVSIMHTSLLNPLEAVFHRILIFLACATYKSFFRLVGRSIRWLFGPRFEFLLRPESRRQCGLVYSMQNKKKETRNKKLLNIGASFSVTWVKRKPNEAENRVPLVQHAKIRIDAASSSVTLDLIFKCSRLSISIISLHVLYPTEAIKYQMRHATGGITNWRTNRRVNTL